MKKNILLSEDIYIYKRRIKAFFYGLMLYFCRIFSVEKNKIVFWAFEGTRGFCCNPKYVAEEILRRNKENGSGWKLIWLVDDMTTELPE